MSTHQRCASVPRRTPILLNPQTLLRASIFLCKWQLTAPRHGGRGGGRIEAQAAPLASGDGSDGWRVQEALVRATARSRAWSRSRVAVEAAWAARSCRGRERGVRGQGGGSGHDAPLHSWPPWAARAARTGFTRSKGLHACSHASPRELREQLSRVRTKIMKKRM